MAALWQGERRIAYLIICALYYGSLGGMGVPGWPGNGKGRGWARSWIYSPADLSFGHSAGYFPARVVLLAFPGPAASPWWQTIAAIPEMARVGLLLEDLEVCRVLFVWLARFDWACGLFSSRSSGRVQRGELGAGVLVAGCRAFLWSMALLLGRGGDALAPATQSP